MSDPNTKQPLPPGSVTPAEDAGSQALSDALKSSFFIVKIIMVLLVVAFLSSGFFTVGPTEKAILLRLGRPVGEGEAALLSPGAHWALPPPIDSIERIPATSVQEAQSSVGWMLSPEERAQGMPIPTMGPNQLDPAAVSYALSADTNIVHVMAVVHYRITDPIRYHFDFSNAAVFVTNDLNNALLYASSRFTVDDILTKRYEAFRAAVKDRMADLARQQGLGIDVDTVDATPSPPVYLTAKFAEVLSAGQRAKTARTEAESYETTTLAAARGTAATRINEAESARSRLVTMVEAQAKEFNDVLAVYNHDPDFYKRVRQMTAMERIYTNATEKILQLQKASELRLNLSREPSRSSTNSVIP
jgi:membrane protease subunit HflK